MAEPALACELCAGAGGLPVWRGDAWRVVRVVDQDFPAFYRVICNSHVAELTDLTAAQRGAMLQAVCSVEQVLRTRVVPHKINIASLGNLVPHLHWHVVARHRWDSHYPQPIWGARQRSVHPPALQRLPVGLAELDRAVAAALEQG